MFKPFVLDTGETVYLNPNAIESFKPLSDDVISVQYAGQLGSILLRASADDLIKAITPPSSPMRTLAKMIIPIAVAHLIANGMEPEVFYVRKEEQAPDSEDGPNSDSDE